VENLEIWKVALATQVLDIGKLIIVYCFIRWVERCLKKKKESSGSCCKANQTFYPPKSEKKLKEYEQNLPSD